MMLFQRRLFLELMGNAVTAMLILVAVLLLITGVQVIAMVEGLSLWVFVRSVPLFLAASLDLVLPISVLVSVVLTYGRAAADNEVDTLRASGVHPVHLLTPGLVFGTLMSVVLLVGMDDAKPHAERAKRRITKDVDVAAILAQKLASGEPEWLEDNMLVSTGSIDERGMAHDVRIQTFDDEGRVVREIVADTARIYVDADRNTIVIELPEYRTVVGDRVDGRNARFEKALDRSAVDLNIRSMTTAQLLAWLRRPPDARAMFKPIDVETEVAMRTSMAAACLVFVLLGLPVALRFRRSDRVGAFLVAFLLALFLYFPSVKVSETLSQNGIVPPVVAAWSGHALLLLASLGFSRHFFRS